MLLPVRGIGPGSVDRFLMFALARPDVLPGGDLGVRQGMQLHGRLRQLPALPAALQVSLQAGRYVGRAPGIALLRPRLELACAVVRLLLAVVGRHVAVLQPGGHGIAEILVHGGQILERRVPGTEHVCKNAPA